MIVNVVRKLFIVLIMTLYKTQLHVEMAANYYI